MTTPIKPATKADVEVMKRWRVEAGNKRLDTAIEDIHSLRATLESWEPVIEEMARERSARGIPARKLMEDWNG